MICKFSSRTFIGAQSSIAPCLLVERGSLALEFVSRLINMCEFFDET